MKSEFDESMMMRALKLAMQGRVTAPPNPWVGCVIVNNGAIVGEGFHHGAGEPHAEVNALKQAQEKAQGATAYVTLEPCSHYGRTPPCTLALIKAKIAKVVIGVADPDSRVSGSGTMALKNAGIEVEEKCFEKKIAESMAPYLHHRRTGLPFCHAKAAVSIDGRIAAMDGTSQWISSNEAVQNAHQLRAESQAIMIGAGTALADKPSLTVRYGYLPTKQPLRVVLDTKGVVLPPAPLFDPALGPTLMITSDKCSEKVKEVWKRTGVEIMVAPFDNKEEKIDLEYVLKRLGERGILQVLIEGGSGVLGSFLNSGLLQRMSVYIGPRILGDKAIPLFSNLNIRTLQQAPILTFLQTQTFHNTVRIDYGVNNAHLF